MKQKDGIELLIKAAEEEERTLAVDINMNNKTCFKCMGKGT